MHSKFKKTLIKHGPVIIALIEAKCFLQFPVKKTPQILYETSLQNINNNLTYEPDMRFPTMWYVQLAKPQTSLRIRAV